MPESREQFQYDIAGAVSTSSKDRWLAPHPGDITAVIVSAGTAPTGADLIVDLEKNGSSMFTTSANRPKVVAGQSKGTKSVTPDVTTFATGDEIALVVKQVGSTVAGSDLNVSVEYVSR